MVYFEYTKPTPISWNPSFKKKDKDPFGCYATFELLQDIFPDSKIEKNIKSLYQTFHNKEQRNTSYIIITNDFDPQKIALETLLQFVDQGNKVFIAAESFGNNFSDTLNFTSSTFFSNLSKADSLPHNFENKYLRSKDDFWLKSGWYSFYFDSIDNATTKVIGNIDKDRINFIKVGFGGGEIFIHSQPYAFTNYNLLLENNAEYTFKTFSYLKNETVIWDENYKPGNQPQTQVSYILSQEPLRVAWYIILVLGLIFLFLGSKRVQRVIPIIKKPENSSLEFAKTLANLYMSGKNHRDIALKKYSYWLDFLREKYYLHIAADEAVKSDKVAEKTGVNEELISRIVQAQKTIANNEAISAEQLLNFNKLIEKFHAFRK